MESGKKLSILEILKEALFAGLRNSKLIISSAMLLALVHFALSVYKLSILLKLNLNAITSLLPLIKRVLPAPGINQVDIRIFPVKIIFNILARLLIIDLSVIAWNGSHFKVKELMLKIKRTWKGLVITTILTALVTYVYQTILLMLLFFLKMMKISSLFLLIVCIALLVLTCYACYISLLLVTMANVSLVVTVVEERCYGFSAMAKAAGLIRRRKFHGLAIFVLLSLSYNFISMLSSHEQGEVMSTELKLVYKILASLFSFYSQLLDTVYYHECKKSYVRGKVEVESGMYGSLGYTSNSEVSP